MDGGSEYTHGRWAACQGGKSVATRGGNDQKEGGGGCAMRGFAGGRRPRWFRHGRVKRTKGWTRCLTGDAG